MNKNIEKIKFFYKFIKLIKESYLSYSQTINP